MELTPEVWVFAGVVITALLGGYFGVRKAAVEHPDDARDRLIDQLQEQNETLDDQLTECRTANADLFEQLAALRRSGAR